MKGIQARFGLSDISTTVNMYRHVFQNGMTKLGKVVDTAIFQATKVG